MAAHPNKHLLSGLLFGCAVALALIAGQGFAAEAESRERSFSWSADVLNSDFRSDTLELLGNVRVAQGPMSIEAEQATATAFRSDNSRWQFEKSVHIQTADAELQSSSASAEFVNGQIADARVQGSPAQFEQRGGAPDRRVRGHAGVIEYDFRAGIVKLIDDVWFSYGKDEFRGDTVVYNIRDERVQVNPGGESPGRVKGIIRPRERTGSASGQERTAVESGA